MGLSGPSPSFAKMGAFLAKQAFQGQKRQRPSLSGRKRTSKGLGNVLYTASKIGYKLGKDTGYKRMGAVGATDHYKNFRKSSETWFVNPPVWLLLVGQAAGKVNWSNNSWKRKNSFIALLKRLSTVTTYSNRDLTAWKNNPTSLSTKAFLLKGR